MKAIVTFLSDTGEILKAGEVFEPYEEYIETYLSIKPIHTTIFKIGFTQEMDWSDYLSLRKEATNGKIKGY